MKKDKSKFGRDLIASLVKYCQHFINKYFKKEKSEFGKGLVVCLFKFYQHFSPEYLEVINIYKKALSSYYGDEEKALSRGITLWAYGASDHLYEIEAPEGKAWNGAREKVKILQDSGLEMGHGLACYTRGAIYTLKDVERLRELVEEILMAVNNKLKLNLRFKESQELDVKMLIKIDKKLGLKPNWGRVVRSPFFADNQCNALFIRVSAIPFDITKSLTRHFRDDFSLNRYNALFIRFLAIFGKAPERPPVRLFGRGWYHWLWPGKRGGLKAKFEGLNFPGLLKLGIINEMIKYSEIVDKYAFISIKDLTNDYANAYNVIRDKGIEKERAEKI